jgi:ABC-type transport system substrate-binding protein
VGLRMRVFTRRGTGGQRLLGLLLAMLVVGCSSQATGSQSGAASRSGSGQTTATKDEIVVRLWDNPQGFDPATLFRIETENVAFNIYDGLTTYHPETGEIVPDLAESWESPDATTWTFKLRHGVKWQGGYGDFTAQDVLYSYNRVLDPATASPYRGEFGNVESIAAPDDYTVIIALKKPDANFLHQVASYHQGQIVKRDAIEKFGSQYQLNPVGTGPFMLESFVQNSEIVLTRFDDHFRGPAKLRKVTYRIIKDDSTAEVALKNREVDLAGRLSDDSILARMNGDSRFTLNKAVGYAVNLLMFNLEYEPFAKPQVRKAFAHAIDRDAIIQATAPITNTRADNMLPDWMDVSSKEIARYPFDPAKSRALLAEAGYPNGFPVKLTGIAASGGASESDLLRQNYLAAVGIKMDFEFVETSVYNQRRNNGDFQLAGRLLPAVNPDTILFGYLHPANTAPKGFNSARYDNPTVTDLLERARGQTDVAARKDFYAQAQRIVLDELPYYPMYQSSTYWPAWTAVKGVQINKLADVDFWPITVEAGT